MDSPTTVDEEPFKNDKELCMKINKLKVFKIVALVISLLFKDYQPQIEMLFNPKERSLAVAQIRDHGLIDVVLPILSYIR